MKWHTQFRAEFPVTQNQIYANIALQNPVPKSVRKAINTFLQEVGKGIGNKDLWMANFANVRKEIAN